jgi:2-haloacid dehalogenase
VTVDWDITAQQAGADKPSLAPCRLALARCGVPPEQVVHVARSLYHDIVPATTRGPSAVWIDRRQGKAGTGATPAASGHPDLAVPDLKTLAAWADGRARC